MAAILDFSARHHLCQFMPAVSETIGSVGNILMYDTSCCTFGRGTVGLPLERGAIFSHCHPTNVLGDGLDKQYHNKYYVYV